MLKYYGSVMLKSRMSGDEIPFYGFNALRYE